MHLYRRAVVARSFRVWSETPRQLYNDGGWDNTAYAGLSTAFKKKKKKFKFNDREHWLMLIFFRYLATGCYFSDIHYDFKLGQSTARAIVRETVKI